MAFITEENEFILAMAEAAVMKNPKALRGLFVEMCINGHAEHARKVYEQFQVYMAIDFYKNHPQVPLPKEPCDTRDLPQSKEVLPPIIKEDLLEDLDTRFQLVNRTLEEYQLPQKKGRLFSEVLLEQSAYDKDNLRSVVQNVQLNPEQQVIADIILDRSASPSTKNVNRCTLW